MIATASMAAQRHEFYSGRRRTSLDDCHPFYDHEFTRDDAAGLAISERFNAQIKGKNQRCVTPVTQYHFSTAESARNLTCYTRRKAADPDATNTPQMAASSGE